MNNNTKRRIIIAIPIAVILIIAICGILYFTTDFLKSNKTLFLKYISQNVDGAKIIFDNKSEKEYTNLLKQNKYEATTEVSSKYTEKINTSEENKNNNINKLKITANTQSEYLNNYFYSDIKLFNNDTNIIRTEYIHENDKYGLRFPNKFNQFLLVNNTGIKEEASKAEVDEKQIELIPDSIEEYDFNNVLSFTDEELESIKRRYIELINSSLSKEKYSKQKNSMITVNENSINTTAYSVTITQEQANDIYIKVLEQLKTDDTILNKLAQLEPISIIYNLVREDERAYDKDFLKEQYISIIDQRIEEIRQNNIGTDEVKCTVYQINGNTVRTQLTEVTREYTIDFDFLDNNANLTIHNRIANDEQANEKTVKIIKNENGNDSDFSIEMEKILGDITSKTEFSRKKILNDSKTEIETGFSYYDEKNNLLELNIKSTIDLNNNSERKVQLDDLNSVIVNEYPGSLTSKWKNDIIDYLKSVSNDNQSIIKNIKEIGLIKKYMNITEDAVKTETEVTTDVEKNRFNAKFEFYTGKEKKTEEIIKMLEETKINISNAQVSYSNEGNTQGTKKLKTIRLEVSNTPSNKPEYADSIKDMLDDSNTYTIEIEKNENDIVNSVIISANKN